MYLGHNPPNSGDPGTIQPGIRKNSSICLFPSTNTSAKVCEKWNDRVASTNYLLIRKLHLELAHSRSLKAWSETTQGPITIQHLDSTHMAQRLTGTR